MSTEKMVASALRGFAKNKIEILPGAAKALKLMSRLAPNFFFHRLSEVFTKLAVTSKGPTR
jgi:uncharacterized oxidoreductase